MRTLFLLVYISGAAAAPLSFFGVGDWGAKDPLLQDRVASSMAATRRHGDAARVRARARRQLLREGRRERRRPAVRRDVARRVAAQGARRAAHPSSPCSATTTTTTATRARARRSTARARRRRRRGRCRPSTACTSLDVRPARGGVDAAFDACLIARAREEAATRALYTDDDARARSRRSSARSRPRTRTRARGGSSSSRT